MPLTAHLHLVIAASLSQETEMGGGISIVYLLVNGHLVLYSTECATWGSVPRGACK
jgi:hypothetical protein